MLYRPSNEAFLALATPQEQIDAVISWASASRWQSALPPDRCARALSRN